MAHLHYKMKIATGLIKRYMELRGFVGFTFPWGVAYIHPGWVDHPGLLRHERCHLLQQHREGHILWTLKNIGYNLTLGYWNNPYEIEARKAAGLV